MPPLAGSPARAAKVRRYGEFRYAAKTWNVERQVIARVEASAQGSDSRFIVTNLKGAPRWLYEEVYCARGQAENLIKAHKLHLASDRTSCSKATANQFRLLIHTAAYWLLHTLRGLAPKASFWRDAQFDTIRLALVKVAGARHRAGDPDQGRAAVLLSRPGQPRRCSPPVPPSCRPDPRGRVPRPSPAPQPQAPTARALRATKKRDPAQSQATRNQSPSRVEDGRGGLGHVGIAPFPVPAHQTGRAGFPHPAFRLASPQSTRHGAKMNPA